MPPSPAPRRPTRAVRVFRALLALYPGEFRDEYGREMALVFADRHRAASTTVERLLVWSEALWGLVTQAPKEHMQMLGQDLRYAVRALRKDKTFALTVLVTLALGIGANTAVFQLIEAVTLRNLPVAAPEELAQVRIAGGTNGFGINNGAYGTLTRPLWYELRRQQQAFSSAFAWSNGRGRLGDMPEVREVSALYVSGDLFGTLGLQPWKGTTVGTGADEHCPAPRAMVSHGYWMREMGGRELSATERLRLNGEQMQIVGVAPPVFTGLAVGEQFDVVIPLCLPREGEQALKRELFDISVVGRLRPGWTHERAAAHVDALSTGLFEATAPVGYGEEGTKRYKAFRLEAVSIASGVGTLRDRFDRALWLLLGMTALVLLMASANLANLLLARAAARDGEVAIRLALGGSRPALARQFLVECGLLVITGAALGVGLAQGLSRLLIWGLSTTTGGGPALALHLDWRVLGFTAAVAAATCLLFALAPIVRTSRIRAVGALGARGASQDRGRATVQRVLVSAQVALSLVLVIGALLFVRTFQRLATFDPGIRRSGITVAMLGYETAKIPREALSDAQRRYVATIKSVPGVIEAATTTNIPLLGATWGHGVTVDGKTDGAYFTWVGPGYVDAMGIRLVDGRGLALTDTRDSARVAIVNQAFARKLTGGANPIGRTLRTHAEPDYPATDYRIVGVFADTKYNSLQADTPAMVYCPDSQFPTLGPWSTVMIRSDLPSEPLMRAVKARLREQQPGMFVAAIDFGQAISDGFVGQRLMAMLAGFFGAVAGLVAVVGIYGMVAYGVERRRREFGVRAALGASGWRLVGMVMRQAGILLAVGLGVGAVLGALAGRMIRTMLFDIQPHDPWILGGGAALLAASAIVASFVPARRAARVNPLEALRQD
jgi:predicted permease